MDALLAFMGRLTFAMWEASFQLIQGSDPDRSFRGQRVAGDVDVHGNNDLIFGRVA